MKKLVKYQNLLYIAKIINFKVINCHHNDFLTCHFGIAKTRELIIRKYY